ncbi:hypothetical protein LSAT2_013660 [Lamellibrachia satsuma]|nr:hypothetical protein LSAT2_013660 [Lamellibrachia satsuma]
MSAAANQQWPVTSRQVQSHSLASESRYSSSDDDDDECQEGCRLTMDENHISPIENLDNTINSLYSYLSGSEGEADMPRPSHRLAPRRNPTYDRRRAEPSPCASSSRSSYESERDRPQDAVSSCHEGESHYSRISDAATLPSIPPIPPPPLDELTRPQVPPRTTYGGVVYGDGNRASRNQPDIETDFEPCFLMQTPSGSVFLPPACASPQGGPPLPYPRPAAGFPQQPQPQWSPCDEAAETSTGATDIDIATQTGLPSSSSVDRQNATLLPPVPTYPSVQNDFHDYSSHFQGRSYEMKQRLRGRCTWKCIALIFIFLTLLLSTLLVYFLG